MKNLNVLLVLLVAYLIYFCVSSFLIEQSLLPNALLGIGLAALYGLHNYFTLRMKLEAKNFYHIREKERRDPEILALEKEVEVARLKVNKFRQEQEWQKQSVTKIGEGNGQQFKGW